MSPGLNLTNFSLISSTAPGGVYEVDIPGIVSDFVGELSFSLIFFTCVFLFYFFWEGIFHPFIVDHAPSWARWISSRLLNVSEMLARLGAVVFFWVAYQSGIIPGPVFVGACIFGVIAGILMLYSLVKSVQGVKQSA